MENTTKKNIIPNICAIVIAVAVAGTCFHFVTADQTKKVEVPATVLPVSATETEATAENNPMQVASEEKPATKTHNQAKSEGQETYTGGPNSGAITVINGNNNQVQNLILPEKTVPVRTPGIVRVIKGKNSKRCVVGEIEHLRRKADMLEANFAD